MLTRNKNRALQNILCNILNNPMNCIPCIYGNNPIKFPCMYTPFLNNRFIMVFDTETTGLLPKPAKQPTWTQYVTIHDYIASSASASETLPHGFSIGDIEQRLPLHYPIELYCV